MVELLFVSAGEFGYEIPHSPGSWSVMIARFAKGDSREIAIPAEAGQEYWVMGTTESVRTDIDICIYGPGGRSWSTAMIRWSTRQPDCDLHGEDGRVRTGPCMTAASVVGGGTAFAGMVVLRELDEGAERGGTGK